MQRKLPKILDSMKNYKSNLKVIILGFIILFGLWLPIILSRHTTVIDKERYWFLADDAMVSMRYARNLADGYGLVWNSDEKIEGYSNFLWTAYMALVHLLPIPDSKASLVILLTNTVLTVMLIPVIIRFSQLLGGNLLAVFFILASYVLNRNIALWASSGLETIFLMVLLTTAAYRVVKESQEEKVTLVTFLLIAVISLVRVDAFILSGLLYILALLLNGNRKTVLLYSLISLSLPLFHEVFRIWYYGDFLPNTAYLKVLNWRDRYIVGFRYFHEFISCYTAVAFAFISRSSKVRISLLGIFVAYGSYIVFAGGDAFEGFRFFVPILPLLFILIFSSVQDLVNLIKTNTGSKLALQTGISIACLLSFPLIFPGYTNLLAPNQPDVENVKLGLLLKENTPSNTKIADSWAGSVFYFSHRYGIDLLGKSDRHIARLSPASNGKKPGHNKFDYDYSLGVLKPDFVITNFKLPIQEDLIRLYSTGDWAFLGQLYLNRVFQEHCLPNPVEIKTWRAIFECKW